MNCRFFWCVFLDLYDEWGGGNVVCGVLVGDYCVESLVIEVVYVKFMS